MIKHPKHFRLFYLSMIVMTSMLSGCQDTGTVVGKTERSIIEDIPLGMLAEEVDTLTSLELIDPYPLYKMIYTAEYDERAAKVQYKDVRTYHEPAWGCSLFAVYSNPEDMLFGRNFDWDFSPGLLLYTDPPNGYASVSMVDISYLGFGGEKAFGLTDSSLSELNDLLYAPWIPFDGLNETGLAVGMAAVPPGGMKNDPAKETIDSVMVIRKILDNADSIEDAVEIIKNYNIDMGSGPPLHYLIADKSGRSVLVEFSGGEVREIKNTDPWQIATNFLVSEAGDSSDGYCWRYGVIARQLAEAEGVLGPKQALNLLEDVAQESTQWSVVYGMTSGEINLVMGGEFSDVHALRFNIK